MARGYVYFIRAESVGRVKIGHAGADPNRRFVTLNIASPVELTKFALMRGEYQFEHALHRRFRAYRVRGEWFEFSPEIAQFVAAYASPWDDNWRGIKPNAAFVGHQSVADATAERLAELEATEAQRHYDECVAQFGPEDEFRKYREYLRSRGIKTLGSDSYADIDLDKLDFSTIR